MKTVVGLYKTVMEANNAKAQLATEGYDASDITVIDQSESATHSTSGTSSDEGVGEKIKHFFSGLTGHDENDHDTYTRGVGNGGAMVAVHVADDEVSGTADLLENLGATNIEGGSGSSRMSGDVAGYRDNAAKSTLTGEQVIPIVEEQLQVGKREVERGGVRVYSRLVSEPVSETVSLHDERVVMDRRAVNRPATDADFANTGAIEVTAMGEEAVVGKTSRVVEEVVVGKQATDRTEEVGGTVRHTEVDVEPVAAAVGSKIDTNSKN